MGIETGVPGKEGQHMWNGITFNDLTQPDAQLFLRDITNWYGRPEFDDPRAPSTGRKGEHVLPGATTGKTVVFEGIIRARTFSSWHGLKRLLQAATISTDLMLGTAHGFNGSRDWIYLATCIDRSVDENPDVDLNRWWQFQGDFAVSLRMVDGRFLALPKNAVGPLPSGTAQNVANAGVGDAEPDFSISNPASNVVLYNATIGQALTFAGLPSVASLTIDFHSRTALMSGGIDAVPFLVKGQSGWWNSYVSGLVSGNNLIQVTGGSWVIGWYETDI